MHGLEPLQSHTDIRHSIHYTMKTGISVFTYIPTNHPLSSTGYQSTYVSTPPAPSDLTETVEGML